MKRLFTLFGLTLLSVVTLSAQEKVKEVVSSTYNRPSVTYVMVDRNWTHSADVQTFFNNLEIGDKYDENIIRTNYINVPHRDDAPVTFTSTMTVINEEKNLGQEIISYLFNRKADGTFDDSIVRERGIYNAKDQDMQNLATAKVQEQALEWGEPLVNTAYIVVLDVYETKNTRADDGSITHSARMEAHAFKLDADQDVLYNFYTTGWADESYSEEERAAAVAAYNNMQFNLKYVTSTSVTGLSSTDKYNQGSIEQACKSAYESVVYNFEKQITGWKTVVGVVSVKPIAAKIGTKEGVKNGDRFQTYSYKEDRKGNLKSVKHGMVRATVVANNKGVATGNTKPSYFYQISGVKNVQEGYILQQKNDLKIGVAGAVGANPFGALRLGLDLDYIVNIAQNGAITYALVNFGTNFTDYVNIVNDKSINLTDVGVGLGYGMPLTRFAEFTPYFTVGGYLLPSEYSGEDGEGKFASYFGEFGARAAVTLQPLSIFIGAGYQVGIPAAILDSNSGIIVKLGIKWTL